MDNIHTRIDKPVEIRRDILEAAVDVTEVLKSYDKIQALNDEKKIFVGQLRASFKSLAKDMAEFGKGMPPVPDEFMKGEKIDWAKLSSSNGGDGRKKKIEADLEEIRGRLEKIKKKSGAGKKAD